MTRVYVGTPKGRRRGQCQWCGRDRRRLNYTVYITEGNYHAARVCDSCLKQYSERLRERIGQNAAL